MPPLNSHWSLPLLTGEGVGVEPNQSPRRKHGEKIRQNCTLYHVVNKAVWVDIGAASTSSTNILVLRTSEHQYIGAKNIVAQKYWCCNVRSTNILVLLVLAAPISAHTALFTTWKSVQFLADFFSMFSSWRLIWLHAHPLSRQ